MRLVLLTLAALVAFAANSILTRAALADGAIGAGAFTAVRLVSGALVLGLLVAWRSGWQGLTAGNALSAAALWAYAVFFSFAYLSLDAGVGALILFAGVQLTMFLGALRGGERPAPARWAGSALGLAGLAVLFLPGAGLPHLGGALMMLVAAASWGIYSLRGGRERRPALDVTAGNFLLAAPAGLLVAAALPGGAVTTVGVLLAMASGALASGLGYAIWYGVLPHLAPSLAAIAQLTVPLIALAGGILFLGEALTLSFAIAAALILGGVALAIYGPRLVAAE